MRKGIPSPKMKRNKKQKQDEEPQEELSISEYKDIITQYSLEEELYTYRYTIDTVYDLGDKNFLIKAINPQGILVYIKPSHSFYTKQDVSTINKTNMDITHLQYLSIVNRIINNSIPSIIYEHDTYITIITLNHKKDKPDKEPQTFLIKTQSTEALTSHLVSTQFVESIIPLINMDEIRVNSSVKIQDVYNITKRIKMLIQKNITDKIIDLDQSLQNLYKSFELFMKERTTSLERLTKLLQKMDKVQDLFKEQRPITDEEKNTYKNNLQYITNINQEIDNIMDISNIISSKKTEIETCIQFLSTLTNDINEYTKKIIKQ